MSTPSVPSAPVCNSASPPSGGRSHALLVLAGGLGVIASVVLGFDLWPGLRGTTTWSWERRVLEEPVRLILPVLIFVATVFVVRGVGRKPGESMAGFLGKLLAVAGLIFAQMLALTAVEPGGLSHLARRVIDPAFTSYHTVASTRIEGVVPFLREYHEIQGTFPVHAPSQPPGRILYFWIVNQIAGSPQSGALLAALLLLAAGALCVFPLAILAGGRCEEGRTRGALLFFASVPSILLFTPQTDHLLLLTTMTSAAAFVHALHLPGQLARGLAGLVSGLAAGAAIFLSLTSAAALLAWGLAIVFGLLGRRATSDRPPLRWGTALLAATLGLALALALPAFLGMNWPAVARECFSGAHRIQVLIFHRTYSEWVARNLMDFALFLGPTLTTLAVAEALREGREVVRRVPPSATSSSALPYGLAFLVTLLMLNFSGKILGETGRIWMFLMPLAALAVARRAASSPFRVAVVIAAAQFLVLLTARLVLNVPG